MQQDDHILWVLQAIADQAERRKKPINVTLHCRIMSKGDRENTHEVENSKIFKNYT